jgi:hypothetical protein
MIDIRDSLFMNIPAGCGDFLYYVVIAILLSKKYKNIYIYYCAVHFHSMLDILNIFINSNKINNIILLSNPEFKKDDTIYKYKKYFDIFSENYNFLELINLNTNTYYSYVYDTNKYETECYFLYVLKLFNLSIYDLFKIDFFLSDEHRLLNDKYYFDVLNKIGNEYIVVFNDPIYRYHDIFSIRQYQKEFNPENLKIIYFTDQFKYNINEYNIKDILGEIKSLYFYNRIIENAKSVHFINSYAVQYFNLIMNNVNYKERFNNVQKNIYSRRFIGRNINHYDINNFNDIDDNNLKLFSNFNVYYPLFFFRNIYDLKPIYYNDNGCSLLHNSGEIINIDNNKFINPVKDEDRIYLHYFTKILQNNITSNKYGISIYDNRFRNKHYVNIDLKEKTIENNYIENLYELNHEENQNIINQYLKENHLNIVLVKFDTIYYIWCKKRELNENNEIIGMDIENAPIVYLKIVEHFIINKMIDYIFPYRNEEDKINYLNLLNS